MKTVPAFQMDIGRANVRIVVIDGCGLLSLKSACRDTPYTKSSRPGILGYNQLFHIRQEVIPREVTNIVAIHPMEDDPGRDSSHKC